jgi:phosphoribosylamine--glycine ligase
LYKAASSGELHTQTLQINPQHAVTVFLVSGGYPEAFEKGFEISGLDTLVNAKAYHAGTKIDNDKVVTNGGRVIAVSALGNSIKEALDLAMDNAGKIQFQNKYYRQDIAQDLLKYYNE